MNFEFNQREDKKENFINELSYYLYEQKKGKSNFEIVFLCIGTDRMTGDCLGPLVGTRLEEKLTPYNIFNITIYGTLKENICYTKIKDTLKYIKKNHQNACIIVIDAALSKEETIGQIVVQKGKILLGKGLHKAKIQVGDISIRVVVGKNYGLSTKNFSSLQNVSLNRVILLSELVADGICEVIKYL